MARKKDHPAADVSPIAGTTPETPTAQEGADDPQPRPSDEALSGGEDDVMQSGAPDDPRDIDELIQKEAIASQKAVKPPPHRHVFVPNGPVGEFAVWAGNHASVHGRE